MSYKVAIVGTGMVANVGHLPAWLELAPAVEVVGVFNHTLTKAQQTADRHGIPHAYDDCGRMMDELRPDIVSVCTPNVSHRAYTEAVLQAGAHVFCEKPIAASYADAVAMYAAAEAAGRHLFVTQTGRFSGSNTAAKQLADSGHLGEMYYAETSAFRRRGVPTWGRFHMKEASGGGPLYDIGVHALDALLWIMGNPKVVAASGADVYQTGRPARRRGHVAGRQRRSRGRIRAPGLRPQRIRCRGYGRWLFAPGKRRHH